METGHQLLQYFNYQYLLFFYSFVKLWMNFWFFYKNAYFLLWKFTRFSFTWYSLQFYSTHIIASIEPINDWRIFLLASINSISFYASPLEISISFFRRNFIYSISCLLHLHEIHYYFLDICYAELWAILHAVSQSHEKDPKVKTVG